MIYKIYRETFRADKRPDAKEFERSINEFQEIYKKYGVRVIIALENVDNPNEGYLITAYRDNAHYEETVAKMRADPKYKELTKEMKEYQENVNVKTMKLMPGSPEP
jgi:GTP cyclohydrolase I